MKFRYERGKFVEERRWSNIIMMHRDVSLIPVRARCDGLRAWYIWGSSSQRPTILDPINPGHHLEEQTPA